MTKLGRSIKIRSYKRRKPGGKYRVVRVQTRKDLGFRWWKFKKRVNCFLRGHDLDGINLKLKERTINFCYRCTKYIDILIED